MKRFALTFAALAAFALPSAAPAWSAGDETPKSDEQVSIPFFDHDNIRDWRADGNRALYIQARNGDWYYGELMAPCIGLNFANTIAFKNRPGTTFDRFGTIIVKEGASRPVECHLTSLVKSDKPMSKKDAEKMDDAKSSD